jgi:hypothetical protein
MRRLEHSSLTQLTLMRIREFLREPEALFWTFLFPVLLALGLGIAFRDSAPQPPRAAVIATAGRVDDGAELATVLRAAGIVADVVPADSGAADSGGAPGAPTRWRPEPRRSASVALATSTGSSPASSGSTC